LSIHVALRHVTEYRYDRAVALSPQLVRLRPAPHCRTPILSYSQRITPSGHFLNWQQDPQSNYVARLTFPEKVNEFRVEVDLVAEMAVYNPFDFFLEPSAEHMPFSYETWQLRDLQPFLYADPLTPRLARYRCARTRAPSPSRHLVRRSAESAMRSRSPARPLFNKRVCILSSAVHDGR
jgi:transglutaminase-like putative cysteine protease